MSRKLEPPDFRPQDIRERRGRRSGPCGASGSGAPASRPGRLHPLRISCGKNVLYRHSSLTSLFSDPGLSARLGNVDDVAEIVEAAIGDIGYCNVLVSGESKAVKFVNVEVAPA